MPNTNKPTQFGLLLFPGYQWLDAAGSIDYINQHNRTLLEFVKAPQSLIDRAPHIQFHYISSEGNFNPVHASSGPPGVPSVTFADCPKLDYLLVPGPDPRTVLSKECIAFIKDQYDNNLKALLTVCTGSMALAQTGILDGVRTATNKWALRELVTSPEWKEGGGIYDHFKKVKWVVDKRFVVDGKVWSAAGVTAGIDLGAEFSRVHFDKEIVKLASEVSEFQASPDSPDPFAFIFDGVKLE